MFLRVVDAYFETVDAGYRQTMPLLHVFGRDSQWQRHHITIDSFRPYFLVTQQAWGEYGQQLANDDRILSVESTDRQGRPEQAIDGTPLLRLVCRTPDDVKDLRELFDDPYEADVKFPVRFLVDFGVFQWIEVADSQCESAASDSASQSHEVPDDAVRSQEPVSADDVTLDVADERKPTEVPPPRVCSYDIEVKQGGRGPPVVSKEGTEQARNPITAITAHDSYTDEYTVWVLAHNDWRVKDSQAARDAVACGVNVYKNPKTVVSMFCEYVAERDFDILTGWNASGFDHPYLVNYALNNNINSIYELSPTRDVYPMDGNGSWINSSLKGRLLLDSLTLYEKTELGELSSYRLADVAEEEEVSDGKLAIEDEIENPHDEPAIDVAWRDYPDVFTQYSLKDVAACVAINDESKKNVSII